ncbi:15984_t:CDS:2, partial [Racocetra persica]
MFQKFIKIQKELLPQFLKKTKTRSTDSKKSDNTETNTSNSVEDEIIDKKIIYSSLLDSTIISSPPPIDDTINNYKETMSNSYFSATISEDIWIVWNYSEYYFVIGRSNVRPYKKDGFETEITDNLDKILIVSENSSNKDNKYAIVMYYSFELDNEENLEPKEGKNKISMAKESKNKCDEEKSEEKESKEENNRNVELIERENKELVDKSDEIEVKLIEEEDKEELVEDESDKVEGEEESDEVDE